VSNKTSAMMYVGVHRGKGLEVATHHRRGAGVVQYGSPGLRCRSTEPPPAADYQKWLDTHLRTGPRGQHGKVLVTGEKLRRAVRMRRNGYSTTEAGNAVGCKNIRKWLDALPSELAV